MSIADEPRVPLVAPAAVELLLVAACWLLAYLLRFYVLPVPVELAVPPVMEYVLPLPLIVGVWAGVGHIVGLYEPACWNCAKTAWIRLGAVAAAEGVIVLAVLRGLVTDSPYSRLVMVLFVVCAFVVAAGVRAAWPTPHGRVGMKAMSPDPIPSSEGSIQSADARFLAVGDILVISLAWLAAYLIPFGLVGLAPEILTAEVLLDHLYELPTILFLYVVSARLFGLYDQRRRLLYDSEWAAIAGAGTLTTILMIAVLRAVQQNVSPSRTELGCFWVTSLFMVAAWRTVAIPLWRAVADTVTAALARWRRWLGRPHDLASTLAAAGPRAASALRRVFASGLWSGMAAFAFNLMWYGWYLSFPLIGEDGAALYSFLIETLRFAGFWTTTFPVKWLEGLGQPNVFVSATFDPFAWVLLLPLSSADAFRLSYALRATTCWVTTYFFARLVFRGARAVAVTSGFLAVLLNFTLTHPWGIPSFAGIFVATHVAVFPGLLCLYWRVATSPRWIGWREAAFGLGLVWFLLMYPLGSLLGVIALAAFGVGVAATRQGERRRPAMRALVKLGVALTVLLLIPVLGLYHAWSAVASVSARNVFAEELTSYPRTYLLPHLWHDVPLGVRLIVFLSLSMLLFNRRRVRPLAPVLVGGALVLMGSQIAIVVRALGIAAPLMDRLPRPLYLEYYLPPFYAVVAAFALHRPAWLWAQRDVGTGRWTYRSGALVGATWLLLGSGVALAASLLGLQRASAAPAPVRLPRGSGITAAVMVAGLFAGAWATWTIWPEHVHPVFAQALLCRDRNYWCRDPAGRTMGADRSPLTDFLHARLADQERFRGRADFVLTPALRVLGFPNSGAPSAEEFDTLLRWYARAMLGRVPPAEPQRFTRQQGAELLSALGSLAASGELPDNVLVEVVEWARRRAPGVTVVAVPAVWSYTTEVAAIVQERNRNFSLSGNGMLQRALPHQGVPVASSYEQTLDYLYFLFWTRYVNAGVPAQRSINMTALETVHPERLGLIGVRYVIARDMPSVGPPALPRVFSWRGYSIYEVPDPNISGYAPTRVVFARTLGEELRAMLAPAFDTRHDAVLSEAEREAMQGVILSSMTGARLSVNRQTLRFRATSVGRSLAVLPFKFSHCWQPQWTGPVGRVMRVDGFLLGVLFDGEGAVELSWTAGYGLRADCLRADAALVPQALAASIGLP